MNIFIRTFVVTFLICCAYFFWAFVGKESYAPDLKTNDTTISKVVDKKTQPKTSDVVKIWLLDSDNKPVMVKRNAKEDTLQNAIESLLSGSNGFEKLQGAYSEIPKNTKLISLKEEGGKIYINLSKEFEEGGGAQSIQARLLQLVKTVNSYGGSKPVYLYIEGQKIEYLGGEGIYVEQPLNEAALKF